MELYDYLKNIYGKNNEELLIKSIASVREELNGLLEERMCKVYSGFLLKELNKEHVPARLINTLDLGYEYEHVFILVPSNDTGYFLVDLTFSQFNAASPLFKQLLNSNYQIIDDESLNDYLAIVTKENINNYIRVDDIFYLSDTFTQSSRNI